MNVVIVSNCISLKLVTIGILNAIAVGGRVDGGEFGRVGRNGVNDDQGAEKKGANYNCSPKLSHLIVEEGEVAILPNNVSWFRGLREFHFLIQDIVFISGAFDIKGEVSRVIRFKGDESGGGNRERIEFLEEIVNLLFLLSHLLEVLSGNEATTNFQGFNEFRVVEGEDYVSNLGSWILLGDHAFDLFTLFLCLAIEISKSLLAFICFINPVVEFLFNLLLQLLLELETRSFLTINAMSSVKDVFLPIEVLLLLNVEFDGEIARGNSGNIPFDLLDLATLVLAANRDSEDKGDEDTSGDGKGNLLVLLLHVLN